MRLGLVSRKGGNASDDRSFGESKRRHAGCAALLRAGGGCFAPTSKSASGYRLYGAAAVQRVRLIQQAQACGFTLADIREFLHLRQSDVACCDDVRRRAIEKRRQISARIRALKTMAAALDQLIAECAGGPQPTEECPILAAWEKVDPGRRGR